MAHRDKMRRAWAWWTIEFFSLYRPVSRTGRTSLTTSLVLRHVENSTLISSSIVTDRFNCVQGITLWDAPRLQSPNKFNLVTFLQCFYCILFDPSRLYGATRASVMHYRRKGTGLRGRWCGSVCKTFRTSNLERLLLHHCNPESYAGSTVLQWKFEIVDAKKHSSIWSIPKR